LEERPVCPYHEDRGISIAKIAERVSSLEATRTGNEVDMKAFSSYLQEFHGELKNINTRLMRIEASNEIRSGKMDDLIEKFDQHFESYGGLCEEFKSFRWFRNIANNKNVWLAVAVILALLAYDFSCNPKIMSFVDWVWPKVK